MLSVGADTHRADAHTGIHQGRVGFVSSRQLSVQQGLSLAPLRRLPFTGRKMGLPSQAYQPSPALGLWPLEATSLSSLGGDFPQGGAGGPFHPADP